jgi:hypothetical protein
MLMTSFGDGVGSKLNFVKQLPFEVTVNRMVTQAPAKQLPDRANAGRAVSLQVDRPQKRIHKTQSNNSAVEIVEEIRALSRFLVALNVDWLEETDWKKIAVEGLNESQGAPRSYQRGSRNPRPPDALAFWR